ncbi:MAG: (Na+)-NQR maturation NqrM [Plesiomonas shigelloides]
MTVFIATFAVFVLVIAGMAIGNIVQKKSIHGSCGGIASLGLEKVCNCPEPCDKRKAKMAEEARLAKLQENRII